MDSRELLNRTAAHAADFLESLDERAIAQPVDVDQLRSRLGGPIPGGPSPGDWLPVEPGARGPRRPSRRETSASLAAFYRKMIARTTRINRTSARITTASMNWILTKPILFSH